MKLPYVSVIIPFFNRINLVQQAVESILEQTLLDFEIILVNDGSTEVISFLSNYFRMENVYLAQQKNLGPSAARNTGIGLARGKYIAFLDSDDLFVKNKLEVQTSLMDKCPEIVMSHTSYQRIDSSDKLLNIVHSGRFSGNVYPKIYQRCPICLSTVMIRRGKTQGIFSFLENIRIAEDTLFFTDLSRISSVLGIDQPLTLYRYDHTHTGGSIKNRIIGNKNIIRYGLSRNDSLRLYQRIWIQAYMYAKIITLFFLQVMPKALSNF